MRDEVPDGPRSLVSTLRIAAEGLNLARTNYVVVLIPASPQRSTSRRSAA